MLLHIGIGFFLGVLALFLSSLVVGERKTLDPDSELHGSLGKLVRICLILMVGLTVVIFSLAYSVSWWYLLSLVPTLLIATSIWSSTPGAKKKTVNQDVPTSDAVEVQLDRKFATGLIDYWFGKKLTVEVPADDGGVIRRQVTQKWLERMERAGKATKIEERIVRVQHLSTAGYRVENWIVGEDVEPEIVDQFLDPDTQELYAMSMYDNGKPVRYFLRRDKWKMARAQFAEKGLL